MRTVRSSLKTLPIATSGGQVRGVWAAIKPTKVICSRQKETAGDMGLFQKTPRLQIPAVSSCHKN